MGRSKEYIKMTFTTKMKKCSNKHVDWLILMSIVLFTVSCTDRKVKDYYEDGHLKREVTVNARNEFDGLMKIFYEDGSLKSISFWNNGVKDGEAKSYFKDGSLNSIETWSEGERHGKYVIFNSNGNLLKEGIYQGGSFSGNEFEYDQEGKLKMNHVIQGDHPVYYEKYLSDGTTEKWYVKFTSEELFIDISDDTISLKDTLRIKFVVNHNLADSIRIFVDQVNKTIFKWPEDGSIKYIHKINHGVVGMNLYTGRCTIYYRTDLDTLAGESRIIPFEIDYFRLKKFSSI